MNYKLEFKPTAVKDVKRLPNTIQKRIKRKLEFYLSQQDAMSYAIPLIGGNKTGDYRFRVGDYRVVFDKNGNTLSHISYPCTLSLN